MARIFYGHGRNKAGDNTQNEHRLPVPKIVMPIIQQSDIILEILDARFIDETRNKIIEQEIKKRGKTIVYVANKIDLAKREEVIEKMNKENLKPFILFSATKRQGIGDLRLLIKILSKDIIKRISKGNIKEGGFEASKDKASKHSAARIGVIGYPNTGKSSIINMLVGRTVSRSSSVAGYTKGIQKIKLAKDIHLLDTPGLIPIEENAMKDRDDFLKHSQISVRMWDKLDNPDLAVYDIMRKYPGVIQKFYDMKEDTDFNELIEELGRRKNFILKGNTIDIDRTSRYILRDFQEGRIKI